MNGRLWSHGARLGAAALLTAVLAACGGDTGEPDEQVLETFAPTPAPATDPLDPSP